MSSPDTITNATELADYLTAQYPDVGKTKMLAIVRTAFGAVVNSLAQQCKAGAERPHVQIYNFGTVYAKKRPARTGRNPKTGETVSVPERYVFKWNTATQLDRLMAGEATFTPEVVAATPEVAPAKFKRAKKRTTTSRGRHTRKTRVSHNALAEKLGKMVLKSILTDE